MKLSIKSHQKNLQLNVKSPHKLIKPAELFGRYNLIDT